MFLTVINHHNRGSSRDFSGTPEEVRDSLALAYPWVAHKLGLDAPPDLVIAALGRSQAYSVVDNSGDVFTKSEHNSAAEHLGYDAELIALISAATFLSGRTPQDADLRRAQIQNPHDKAAAVLQACGLPPDSRQDLLTLLSSGMLQKAEISVDAEKLDFTGKHAEPAIPSIGAQEMADNINASIAAQSIFTVKLDGKYSKGAAIAEVPYKHIKILLKPGTPKNSPAAGVKEESSNQANREAAFSEVASKVFGSDAVPEVHLISIDSKPYSCGRLLPFEFKNLNSLNNDDPGGVRRAIQMYRPDGTLHRWAAMDYIMGNPDRNAGNIMMRSGVLKLIDHGSAFAGKDFSPATDGNSYVPYYLRALAPDDFEKLPAFQRLNNLPRLSDTERERLSTWLRSLDASELANILYRYGIDAKPSVDRLNLLVGALAFQPADLAVLSFWVM